MADAITSLIRSNAERDPNYAPHCLRCTTMARMRKLAPMHWKCAKCGAEHDGRITPTGGAA